MITIEEKLNSKVPGTSSLYVSFEYNKDIVEALKNSVTVANYDKKSKVWEAPVTDLASIINSVNVFDDIELKLKPDEKKHTVKVKITLHILSLSYIISLTTLNNGLQSICKSSLILFSTLFSLMFLIYIILSPPINLYFHIYYLHV